MIDERLSAVFARVPERTAIVFGDRRITYRELDERISGLRAGLRGLGVGAGDQVLIVLPNCPEFVVGYFATAGLRAVVQALDPALKEHEFLDRLRECDPAVVITTAAQAPFFETLATRADRAAPALVVVGESATPAPGRTGFDGLAATAHAPSSAPKPGDAPWVVTYSSGTTGEPKRISRSQANQAAEAHHIISSARITEDDVILCPVPLFHALGQFCCMIVSVLAGATLVLVPQEDGPANDSAGAYDVARILALVRNHGVTVFPSVPYLLTALADWPADRAADLSSVRLCLSGSNFLPPAVAERFGARFGVPVRQTYGSSEAGSVSWDCDPGEVVPQSVGRPLNGVTVEVLDEHGHRLPPGETGEIAVTSGSVMAGDTGRQPGGRYLTGDIGRLGTDGRLYVTGRKRILIDTGGHKVNPVEIEAVLEKHPDVAASGVVGVPLRDGGDLLVAAVVPAGAAGNTDRLAAYCRERLADYKVPAVFTFVDDIPRTSLGKIRRSQLADSVAARAVERGHADDVDLDGIRREQDPAARARLITGYLLHRIAAITGADPDGLAPTASPHTLGLDSLGALRLKMAVQDELHLIATLPDLLGGGTVESIAAGLAGQTGAAVLPLTAGAGPSGEFPLSANQLSIWHADQLAPETAAYNQAFAGRIGEGCDTAALHRAFQALTDRHPVLRTTFHVRDGRVIQRVADRAEVDFQVVTGTIDLAHQTEELSSAAFRPFALETEHPLRVRLYTGTAGGPVLLVTVHHIVTDFWSLVVTLRELAAGYRTEISGAEVYRPAPAHTYTDFTRWQAERLGTDAGLRDWEYWREVLRNPPPALELPLDRPRPVVSSQRGATHFHELDPGCVRALQAFARSHDVTVYTVLLATFQVLLHHCSAQRDIAVAAITTNRQRHEFSDVLGYFVNPVVCRTRIDPDEPFDGLLDRVRTTLLEGLEHQLLPFGTLVERLGIRRDRGRAPLVEVGFGQNKAHDGDLAAVSRFVSGGGGHTLRLGELTLESVPLRQSGMVYDFSGSVYEAQDSLSIGWEYNTDLFDAATVARMAARFENLLRAALGSPGLSVGRMDPLDATERAVLLAASHGGPRPQNPSLPRRAAQQARRRPHTDAVVAGADRLTHAELTARAARLAAKIRAVRPRSDAVGVVWLPPSTALAVAGLAALTAAVACDPVDGDGSPEQVRAAVADGGASLVITSREGRERLGPVEVPVVCVEDAEDGGDAGPVAFAWADGAGEDVPGDTPAVVLRTSGVTGGPRATLLSHRALADSAAWHGDRYGPLDGGVLVHGALRPDRRLATLLTVVAAGGTAVLTTEGTDPGALAGLLCEREFALARLSTTELALVLPALAATGRRPRVATLAVTGEPLPGGLVRRWRDLSGPTRVVHEYGGAETLLVVSAYEVPPDRFDDGPVPVGRPVPGVDRRVLGPSGQLCPVGVPGEICVDEAAVALPANPADDRADRFVTLPGSRMYRTGDLGCYLPGGDVVVLGRACDRTVIHGYRVDPARVEAELMRLSGVAHAVVVADTSGSERRLVARVVPREDVPGDAPTAAALTERLRRVLPEYMVPAMVVTAAPPTTAGNGRAARNAQAVLTVPGNSPATAPAAAAPAGWVETRLAAIWSEFLGVPHVGPDDDYFDLDGDSITGMRIVSRAAEEGIRITPRQLFTCPVLRDLAAAAEVVTADAAEAGPSDTVVPAPEIVPLSPAQRWFFDQGLSEPGHWNQSVVLRTRRPADLDLMAAALRAVAVHHPAFRHRYTGTGPDTVQRYDPEAEPIRLVRYEQDSAGIRGGLDAVARTLHTSLDLERGPVFAAALVPRESGGELSVLLVAHHLVIDFVSWQIVLDDLARAYEQLLTGNEVRLPATSPYSRWTRLLQEHAGSEAVHAQAGRWTAPPGPAGDASVPVASHERDARVRVGLLSAEDTTALLARTDGPGGIRPQDVVLAAVVHAVTRWTGRRHIRVDLEGHGREQLFDGVAPTRTVGWFTTMYPAVFDVAPGLGPAALLRTVRDAVQDTPDGGIGYGLLRYLATDPAVRARMAAVPPSPVVFNYLGRLGELLGGAGRTPGYQRLFTTLPPAEGMDRGPGNLRPHALEISAALTAGRLRLRVVDGGTGEQPRDTADLLDLVQQGIGEITSELGGDRSRQLPSAPPDRSTARADRHNSVARPQQPQEASSHAISVDLPAGGHRRSHP
ncbi:condensation domain-containing protein [Streptomyces sp. NPDC004270]